MTKRSSWSIPYLVFLIIFVVLPLLLICFYAFQDEQGRFTFENFAKFFSDSDSLATFALSLEIAIETTVLCILIGFPAAWILANSKLNSSVTTVALFILPMWVNALIRTLATAELFNILGATLGKGTLLFGMVYDYLPFMIYPTYITLNKMPSSYAEAAQDLGASPWKVFWKVTVPLAMPGVWSGVLMVFMPTVSTFAISEFLTNNKIKLFGTIIQENINSSMWNYGAALSLVMLFFILLTTLLSKDGNDDSTIGGVMI